MPKRKGLRVIYGGKSCDCGSGGALPLSLGVEQLLEKVDHYRKILSEGGDEHLFNLVTDMADAIDALRLLEKSAEPTARRHAREYRSLIAELEIEVVAALHKP